MLTSKPLIDPRTSAIVNLKKFREYLLEMQSQENFHNGLNSLSLHNTTKCEICKANSPFFGWPFCWECGTKVLSEGEAVEPITNLSEILSKPTEEYKGESFDDGIFEYRKLTACFTGNVFTDCCFRNTRCSNVDFSNRKFVGVDFTGATFNRCNFKNATFENCLIRYVKFENCMFENTELSKLHLFRSLFSSQTELLNCSFHHTEVFETYFDNCSLNAPSFFNECKMTRPQFNNCEMIDCDFREVEIEEDVAIYGEDTIIERLKLSPSQKDKFVLPEHYKFGYHSNGAGGVSTSGFTNTSKSDTFLKVCPVSAITVQPEDVLAIDSLSLFQQLSLADVKYGFLKRVRIIVNCFPIGILISLIYCVSRGIAETESFLYQFVVIALLLSLPIICFCLFGLWFLEKNLPHRR